MDSDLKLAWLWAIEYLASFPQIDPSILHDLIDVAPEALPVDLGKNTRERVAFRCMEHLFCSDNVVANNDASTSNPKVSFDLSKSSEDVLLSMLNETPVSDLRMAGSNLLKWDVQPFIMHKRASLPKCALEQLKDAILEGSHPYTASLIEASGLMHKDGESDIISMDSGRHNDVSTQIMAQKGSTISSPLQNNQGIREDDSGYINLLPMKRNEDVLANENNAGNQENECGIDAGHIHLNAKRLKPNSSSEPREQIVSPHYGNELVGESFRRTIGGTEKESLHAEGESQEGRLGESKSLENGHGISPNANTMDEVQHNQREIANGANKLAQNTCGDGSCQDILVGKISEAEPRELNDAPSMRTGRDFSIGNTRDNSDSGNHKKLPNDVSSSGFPRDMTAESSEYSTQHLYEEDTSSDEDNCDFEKVDVASERSQFLSSQCTLNHASVSGWTELNLCVICSEDAHLLVCSAVGCPLVVHEKCLGCSPKFDEKGNFYCPFCSYSYAIAKYLEAKKKAALARKELLAFIRHCPKRPHRREHHSLKRNGDEALPPKIHKGKNLREKDRDHTNNMNLTHGEEGPENESEGMDLECPSVRGHDRQDKVCSSSKHSISSRLSKNKEMLSLNQREAGVNQKEDPEQQSSDLSKKLVCAVNVGEARSSDGEKLVCAVNVGEGRRDNGENEENAIFNHSLRPRIAEARYVPPAMSLLRRKKVPWTAEEEEMLKEGIQKFSKTGETKVQWKAILEYGRLVFWSGRTAVDLKDKWRNMSRGTPKCK